MNDEENSILQEIIQWCIIIIPIIIVLVLLTPSKSFGAEVPTAGIIAEIAEWHIEEKYSEPESILEEPTDLSQIALHEEQKELEKHERMKEEERERLLNSPEFRYMCAIIWAESNNQPAEGQKAVGIVVQNRIESDVWPNTILEVLYQKNQFQPTWNGAFEKGLAVFDNGEINESVAAAAEYALTGGKLVDAGWSVVDMSDYYFFNTFLDNPRLVLWDHRFK